MSTESPHTEASPSAATPPSEGAASAEGAAPSGVPPEHRLVAFTDTAQEKVREAIAAETPRPAGLRLAVVGGGCAGFQYTMNFDDASRPGDWIWSEEGFQVFVDKMSAMYLNGVQIDYVTELFGAGFKFSNPNVSTTCGCGSSFA